MRIIVDQRASSEAFVLCDDIVDYANILTANEAWLRTSLMIFNLL